jgi:hypothetical protein
MGTIYSTRDDVVQGMMDSMHRRLTSGTGRPLPGGPDNSANLGPTNRGEVPPVPPNGATRIKGINESVQRIRIPSPA